MVVSNSFKKYVEEGNLTTIKVSLVEFLKNDLTHNIFNEYIVYLENSNVDIYEPHDGESYTNSEYTERFLTEQCNQMIRNFSKERLRCIQAIQYNLYGEQMKVQRKEEIKHNNSKQVKAVGSMFILGGTLLTIGSIIFSGSIGFVVLGIVSVVGGVVVLIANKEN